MTENGDDHGGDVPNDGQFHGPQLDAAMRWSGKTAPPDLGVCITALDARAQRVIDQQAEEEADPDFREVITRRLMESGLPFDEEAVTKYVRESLVGGAFTFGLGTGLHLERSRGPLPGSTIIDRSVLDVLVEKAVGSDATEFCRVNGIDAGQAFVFLEWLASSELKADTEGRIGFAFQVGFEAGQLRLAEAVGRDDADYSEHWKSLSDAERVDALDRARGYAFRYGNEARRQRDAIRADVDAAVGTKVNRLYALEDAIHELREGRISHDEFMAQVDAAPPLEPKP